MAEKTKYARLFDLHRRFMGHARLTIPKMMEDYGINRRTANRDINDLMTLGVELDHDVLSTGLKSWYLPAAARKISVPFNLTDLAALFMGRRLFDFSRGTLLEESLDKIYDSIETQISREKDFMKIKDLKRKVHIINEGPKQLKKKNVEQLDEILTGLMENRLVEFTYTRANGETRTHTVAPYTLTTYHRGLYLLACVNPDTPRKVRMFAIERITKASALRGTQYDLPEDWDPEDHFKSALFMQTGAPQKVELLFTQSSAPFISIRKFHPSQRLKTRADGRILMTLKVPAADTDFEILNWIMGFHQHVEVLSPPGLRQRVKECLQTTLKSYR